MRILVVNSNTTPSVTDRIGDAARAVAAPGTVIDAISAPYGLPLIVSRADWMVAGPATVSALAARRGTFDAAVIACFGDPGLDAAKELLDVPVIGISEAAFHAACMLGRRFGVVSFTTALKPMFEECLAHHGLTARCTGFRMGPAFAGDAGSVAEDRAGLIADLVRDSVEKDGAEAVILAGGPLAGLAPVLQPHAPVPLLDGTQAAVKMAEAMAELMPRKPMAPRARALTGYDSPLERLYGG